MPKVRTTANSWRVAFRVMLVFCIAVACSPGGLWDPEGLYWTKYDGWGNQLQQHRSETFVWRDGSGWTDGVSSAPPDLPLRPDSTLWESLTCAQEEVLIMVAFPNDEDPEDWYLQPNAEAINLRWQAAFASLVWGDAEAPERPTRTSFWARCGLASHYRLFQYE